MKKIIIAAALALSFSAQAASAGKEAEFCGVVAESSAEIVDLHNMGVPWAKVAEVLAKHLDKAKRLDALAIGIQQEAYYSWHRFEPAQIKQLAFMKCKLGLAEL